MDASALEHLDTKALCQVLPSFLSSFIADDDIRAACRARMKSVVESWSEGQANHLLTDIRSTGAEYKCYAANPVGRALSRAWCKDVVIASRVIDLHHLRNAATAGPTVVLCNHFSYMDATATDAMLAYNGAEDLADRLLFAAGPKVFDHLFRRVAAASLNTVKVPQSTSLSHTSRMTARELATLAIASMDSSRESIKQGMVPLLYPEGSRTRDGHLQSFIRGVHRYLRLVPEITVVPAVILGTDQLMGVGNDEKIVPSRTSLQFLPPLVVGKDGGSRDVLEAVYGRISSTLPPNHRHHPGMSPLC
ncbi:MAG: hypothetical protein GWP91_20295 [Rhodobacterales bacterium]|nr:hypothetical protein [Rhodobacterales bacterium]